MNEHIDTLTFQGPATPMSTEGGCVGTTVQVTIAAFACDTTT